MKYTHLLHSAVVASNRLITLHANPSALAEFDRSTKFLDALVHDPSRAENDYCHIRTVSNA